MTPTSAAKSSRSRRRAVLCNRLSSHRLGITRLIALALLFVFLSLLRLSPWKSLKTLAWELVPLSRHAYLTLLCDDIMAKAAMTLVHSIKRTGTPHDVVVLALNISNQTRLDLEALGARVQQIVKPVEYPYKVTQDRLAINKPCRYSKLLSWNMTEYSKIVYLDGDMLVLKNIDELFLKPNGAAVPDVLPPDRFNSGLMVIKPDAKVFQEIVDKIGVISSPNVGDQGFLNNLYPDWFERGPSAHLDSTYNGMVRNALTPGFRAFQEPDLKILHFSGSSKPWNKAEDKQHPTTRKFDPLWWQAYEEMTGTLVNNSISGSITPLHFSDRCQRDYMAYTRGDLVPGKLSVVMNSFDRFESMTYLVRRYARFEFVHKIYIVWGNTHVRPFPQAHFGVSTPVEILYSGLDNMNDRFLPIRSLQTEAVLVCDDDIEVDPQVLRFALDRWQASRFQLVGFFPRAHYRDQASGRLVYVMPRVEYSMVLTKVMLMNADYLRAYSCDVPPAVRAYVEARKNCEDIAMNFLASQACALPPLLVMDRSKKDFGTHSGLSNRSSHDDARSRCLNDLEALFGTLPLQNSSDALALLQAHDPLLLSTRLADSNHLKDLKAASDIFHHFRDSAASIASWTRARVIAFFFRLGDRFQLATNFPITSRARTAYVSYVPSDVLPKVTLCVHVNQVPLLSLNPAPNASLPEGPPDGRLQGGTTVLIQSQQRVQGVLPILSLLSALEDWRRAHGCFQPSRVLFYRNHRPIPELGRWSLLAVQALASRHMAPEEWFLPLGQHCFERAVLLRQRKEVDIQLCFPEAPIMLQAVRAFCHRLLRVPQRRPFFNARQAVVLLSKDDADLARKSAGEYAQAAEAAVEKACQAVKLKCTVKYSEWSTDLCKSKLVHLSDVHLVVSLSLVSTPSDVLFLRRGAVLVEALPHFVTPEAHDLTAQRANCTGVSYVKALHEEGHPELQEVLETHLKLLVAGGVLEGEGNSTSVWGRCVGVDVDR